MKIKRIMAMGFVGCMLVCSSMQVNAATLEDVFDEHYYADSYEDLRAAFGYDREALWNHFVTYGLSEGRSMNELIDVVKYREKYEDLQEAFGDDWDAYLNHFLNFGAQEGRDAGTGFEVLDYVTSYEELQEAFGGDVLALWSHYQTSRETEVKSQESQKPQEAQKPTDSVAYTEREDLFFGGYDINEYNSAGKLIRCIGHDANDRIRYIYEYNDNEEMIKSMDYLEDGSLFEVGEMESDGSWKRTTYHRDGSIWDIQYI